MLLLEKNSVERFAWMSLKIGCVEESALVPHFHTPLAGERFLYNPSLMRDATMRKLAAVGNRRVPCSCFSSQPGF
jgi:hypothetical protein